MINTIQESPLYSIVNPRSIAVFGASNKFSAMGTSLLASLKAIGFKGDIYPVHPREERVLELPAYQRVADLPVAPDCALIVLPTAVVPQVLEECGQRGIKHAIVVSGGFKEVGGEGIALEKQIISIAEKYEIRFLGPNCIGVVNTHHHLNVTFFQYEGEPGYVGMASQSGSFITQMFDYLSRFRLGFSTAFSVGNEANIDIVDCMEYLAACPQTRVITLYIEAIRRGREFIECAREIVPRKPIVAYYVGGSEAGKRAGLSHTGALAGPDELYNGVFQQSGVIRAHSIEELFDFCWALSTCHRSSGNRVIVQTHSGGPGAAAADACSRSGLVLPTLSNKTQEQLGPYVPHTGTFSNPVDLTFTKNPLTYFSEIPGILLDDANADGLIIYFLMPGSQMERSMRSMGVPEDAIKEETEKVIVNLGDAIAGLRDNHKKPIIGYTFDNREGTFFKRLDAKGIPVFPGPVRAARAFASLVQYDQFCKRISS